MRKIRILIADDHGVVRKGLRFLLASDASVEVVAEASHGREAIELAEKHEPDVAILDIAMPLLSGTAAAQITRRQPRTGVIILSMHSDEEFVLRALSCGAKGYLLKDSAEADLLRAVEAVAMGRPFFSPAITQMLLDRNDRMITTLAPQQIRLFEEGVPQQIRSFSLEQAPVSIALLLDLSGSMKRSYPHVREALARFSAGLAPGDEYTVVTFRDRPQVRIPFSRDPAALEQWMSQEQPDGSTALIDALVLALEEVLSGRNRRKAILVLSDSVERSSRYTWKDLPSVVRESTAPLYVFLLPGFEQEATDDFELWRIVEESGGRVVQVGKPSRFPEALDRLEIHQQYVIGYTPTNRTRDGRFRRVKIELAGTGGKMHLLAPRILRPERELSVRRHAGRPCASE